MHALKVVAAARTIISPASICSLVFLTCSLAGGCQGPANTTKLKTQTAGAEQGLTSPGPLFPFCDRGEWGYINRLGQVVIKPRFAQAYDFADGRAYVHTAHASEFIDEQGKLVVVPARLQEHVDWIGSFTEGRAAFSVKHKCGYFDRRGKVVIEPQFGDARAFSEGLAAVNVGAKYVPEFPHPHLQGGEWGFIDKAGRLVIPARFDSVEDFSEGLSLVWANSKMSYIDKKGKAVIRLDDVGDPKRWATGAGRFLEGLAWASTFGDTERFGFIDKAGKFVIRPRFEQARHFSGGLAAVAVGDKWGYVDHAGRVVIRARFREARDFSGGLAAVRIGEGWRYIDKKGMVTIPGPYNDVQNFSGHLARVHLGGRKMSFYDGPPPSWGRGAWFYINRDGKKVRRAWQDEDRPPW
ncbi:MAG TPA: WG repeat-containing protein [Gemmataceae bacterium]|nr:WG repeat-containing protein [Gemmataceae bacterium]